jgi:hypothetical protein
VEAGPSGRCRLDTIEPEASQIQRIDEGVDHANRILLVDPVVEAFRQKRRLSPICSLDKPLHDHPRRIIRGIIEWRFFSHSQGRQLTWVTFALNVHSTSIRPMAPCRKFALGHVWTAPGCQGIDHVAALVGAAMCSAYQCGSQGRWP